MAGRIKADGEDRGGTLIDLAPYIRDGRLNWQAPAGKWRIIKFTHMQAPGFMQAAN